MARLKPRSVVLAIGLALLAIPVPSAWARTDDSQADEDRESALRAKANGLMASSKWSEALPIWGDLFGLGGKSLDLWNAAVCQYHLAETGAGTPEQAVAAFRQYQNLPDVPEEKRAKAQRYIDQLQALKQRKAEQAAAPAPAPPPAAPPAPRQPPESLVTTSSAASPEPHSRALRISMWSALGVGAAGLAAGAAFGWETRSLNNKVTNEPTFNAADDSAGHRAETLQFVMYGVSAAALVAAGVLYYVDHRASSVSVALVPAPGGPEASMTVRF